ncbi:imelysin family protein [Ancylobacter pratisalsi]|uniref:Imelysin family protein n=1 Tax=Ancylobacter pratisalsi TaxID=1745854 RepID=A0A6P1YRC1_9HYPH|nr:imelysin family protein [Ancylobacter pratisalsi]QIB36018.1 imelysin family protein [Ancylobacter pratisalsi]
MSRSPFALGLALLGQIGQAAQGVPAVAAATTFLTGVFATRAHATAVSAPDVVEQWLLPRYDKLAADAQAQLVAWEGFCKAPSKEGVKELKARFDALSLDWSGVEFITFGPVMLSLRADRFNLFPERRNAVGRSVAELISDETDERLQPKRFFRLSAAAQGLPAMERLLYDEGADAALLSGPEAGRRCALGLAIAGNLAKLSGELREGWGDRSTALLGQLYAGKSDPVFFPDPNALLSQMVTDLAGAYQRVVDQRLLVVLGKNINEAKPLISDRRRSGLSKATIVAVVTSAGALGERLAQGLDPKSQQAIATVMNGAVTAAKALPEDIGAAAETEAGRKQIETAIAAFKAAQASVADPLAAGLGVPLGFNALDGD